jgi:ABC-type maltose transport system permease subunit
MISFKFIPHFAIRIACAFVFFTAFGTITHELGHWTVAKYLGYEAHINYRSTRYYNQEREKDSLFIEYQKIWSENYEKIEAQEDFDQRDRWEEVISLLKEKYPYDESEAAWVTFGGPAQTLLTGCIGLLILFYRKSKYKEYFVFLDWVGVFLALFVLREVFNFVSALFYTIVYGQSEFPGDEFRLSVYLEINQWAIPAIGMLIGLLISLYVIFRVIPLKYRFTFILAGLVGGSAGFAVWFGPLGPMLFP